MEKVKSIVALVVLLAVGIAIAVAEPQGILAVVLTQLLALAVIGAGGAKLSKSVVSVIVFLVAGTLAWFKLDGAFPAFPGYLGDPVAFFGALFAWVQAFAAAAAPIVGAAMVTYNLILEKLLVLIGDNIGYALEPVEE